MDRREALAVLAGAGFIAGLRTESPSMIGRTRESALSGKFEFVRDDADFDGTSQNPSWMGQLMRVE